MNTSLQYQAKTGDLTKCTSDCLILGVVSNRLSKQGRAIDKLCKNQMQMLLKRGDLSSEVGSTLLIPVTENKAFQRILLVNAGDDQRLSELTFKKIVSSVAQTLKKFNSRDGLLCLEPFDVADKTIDELITSAIFTFEATQYQFDELKSLPKKSTSSLKKITFHVPKQSTALSTTIQQACAIAKGVALAKRLGNLPGNICTPEYLAKQATQLAKSSSKMTCKVLNEADMKKLGMNTLLSVSHGSEQPAKLIVLTYKGSRSATKPIVLVGKGITFDSGGISLKPSPAMDEMKYDMCGAASVLGTLLASATLKLPVHLVGVIAASENLPGGSATKPGDIVKSLSGQTVEILNTDAEGRLVLCDALTYVERFKPKVVIDIATLTGAMVVAMGSHGSGLMTNHQPLANDLLKAGKESGDRTWQFPLWDEYQENLDSNFADMANISSVRGAGSITAGCFLSRFTKNYHWAHLDIAGVAWHSGKAKGATGRPVPLLVQYILNHLKST